MSVDDIECVRRGNYLVIKGTNVAVHETEDKIIGIVVQVEEDWINIVPPKPTKQMIVASKEYCYELPIPFDKDKLLTDLQNMHDDISQVQRKLIELESVKKRIENIQHSFQ
jgi:hypothetical protein